MKGFCSFETYANNGNDATVATAAKMLTLSNDPPHQTLIALSPSKCYPKIASNYGSSISGLGDTVYSESLDCIDVTKAEINISGHLFLKCEFAAALNSIFPQHLNESFSGMFQWPVSTREWQ